MSLANYLNNDKIITTEQISLTQEPNDFDDGARISDTIVYMGNATYLKTLTQVIAPNQQFTPLFFDPSGLSPPLADYLNVRPSVDLFNFQQLANITYKVFVNSHSSFNFSYRLSVYDASLIKVLNYEAITYDPSNNAKDPPVIDGINFYGYSVILPTNAVYAFLEVKNNTTGSIEFQFDIGNSQLENAVDNSIQSGLLGSRASTNIFSSDYYVAVRDASGVERDITILEAEVAQLQTDVSALTIDVSQNTASIIDISNEVDLKVNRSGDTMTGALTLDFPSSGFPNGFALTYPPPPLLTDVRSVSLTDGGLSFNNTNGNTVGQIQIFNNQMNLFAGSGISFLTNTLTDPISFNSRRISSVGDPNANTDATTKQYVDGLTQANTNAIATKLPLSGGTMTGSINLNGTNRITNSANPVAIGDLTNKAYVDNADTTLSNAIQSKLALPANSASQQNIVAIEGTTNISKFYRFRHGGSNPDGDAGLMFSDFDSQTYRLIPSGGKLNILGKPTFNNTSYDYGENLFSLDVCGNLEIAGKVSASTPTANTDLTTKAYVDNAISSIPTTTPLTNVIYNQLDGVGFSPNIDITVDLGDEYDINGNELTMDFFIKSDNTGASSVELKIEYYDGNDTTLKTLLTETLTKVSGKSFFPYMKLEKVSFPTSNPTYNSSTPRTFTLSLNTISGSGFFNIAYRVQNTKIKKSQDNVGNLYPNNINFFNSVFNIGATPIKPYLLSVFDVNP